MKHTSSFLHTFYCLIQAGMPHIAGCHLLGAEIEKKFLVLLNLLVSVHYWWRNLKESSVSRKYMWLQSSWGRCPVFL